MGSAYEFSKDLCKMAVSSNIPWHKVEAAKFSKVLGKIHNSSHSQRIHVEEKYLASWYEDTINKIRNSVEKNKIWVCKDETSDVDGRFVANVVVGTLKHEQPGKMFLLACEVLGRVNNSSIAVVFDNAMNMLWPPDKAERENVLLFVSDAAPYMIKAAKALQVLYPKMIHVTFLAHALHRVAEDVRGSYPEVDKLIANGKKIFIKSPLRVH